jgi:hypothetical protein
VYRVYIEQIQEEIRMINWLLLKKVLLIIFIGILFASVFIYLTPMGRNVRTVLAETISITRYQQYTWVLGVEIRKEAPPLPNVISENTVIPTTQSSYCWGKIGCADYAGGKTMLEGKTPTIVTPGSNIKISFDYKPSPSQLNVQKFKNDKSVEVPLKDSYFKAPTEKGVCYYGISADWTTDDGKHSGGQTSSVFAIEVK